MGYPVSVTRSVHYSERSSYDVLSLAHQTDRDDLRFWFDASGRLTGVWRDKGGRRMAVAQLGTRSIIYRCYDSFEAEEKAIGAEAGR
jgi:hypothetical protein